ncbi:MAG TPA: TIM barrel protein [Fimbriimonadaceae bacterium]|nr:TIM barrel protein [Fimbriimonadaceae bacterium]
MRPFGLQLYTLRDLLQSPTQIAATLHDVRAIGYEYVQVSGLGPIDNTDLRRHLDAEGLTCVATHCGFEELRTSCETVVEKMHVLGCKDTAVGYLPKEYHNAQGYHEAGRILGELGARMQEQGLYLSYHNHAFEFERYDGRTGHEILFEAAGLEHLSAELDTYWLVHAGCDPIAWLEAFEGFCPLLHLKDRAVVQGEPEMVEVGYGNLNWDGILRQARRSEVEWYLVEQDHCRRPPLESAKLSLERLSELWAAGEHEDDLDDTAR